MKTFWNLIKKWKQSYFYIQMIFLKFSSFWTTHALSKFSYTQYIFSFKQNQIIITL